MIEEELGALLRERKLTLAVAETTTGGLISHRIVRVPGSSAYFDRGIIAYSSAAKLETLGLPQPVLDTYGTVSAETASAMAQRVRLLAKTVLGLAETGIAGPVQRRSPKPVGLCYIALATADTVHVGEYRFAGDRRQIQEQIAEQALHILVEYAKMPGD